MGKHNKRTRKTKTTKKRGGLTDEKGGINHDV
jgi:hypothetical protein